MNDVYMDPSVKEPMRIVQKVWVILRDTRGAILILEEKMNDGDYHLTIPKGAFEPKKDSSLMWAVKREIYEETGLTDYVLHTCLSCHPKYYETYISLLIVFEGRIWDDASPHANYRMKNEDIRSYFFLSKKSIFHISTHSIHRRTNVYDTPWSI